MISDEVDITFIPRKDQHSDYDWANITVGVDRVGKARCKIDGDTLTIYSINVFPEFEGNGYGRLFCEVAKKKFDIIVADRVRHSAVGFWEKMDFADNQDGNWVYKNKKQL